MKIRALRLFNSTIDKACDLLGEKFDDPGVSIQVRSVKIELTRLKEMINGSDFPTEWRITQRKSKRNLLKPRQRYYYTISHMNGEVTLTSELMQKEAMISGSEHIHQYLEKSYLIRLS